MRYVFIFLFFGLKTCYAQRFFYPKLSQQGNTLEELIPKNWKLIDTAFGDLNHDQVKDVVLVLEHHLPISENRAYGDNETDLIKEFQRPRLLAIYFKNKQTNKYVFVVQNTNFILRSNEGGVIGDPFKGIRISNENLLLDFEGGSNWRWKLNYEFNYRNKAWSLIGANTIYYHNETGQMTEKKYNFLNRRAYLVTGNIFNSDTAKTSREEILYFTELRTFDTFKKPWTWEITKDNFL